MRTFALIAVAFTLNLGTLAFGAPETTDGPEVMAATAAHAVAQPLGDESLPIEDSDADAGIEVETDAVLPTVSIPKRDFSQNFTWQLASERRDDEFMPAPDPRPPRA